jgi:hypothetical protein
MRAEESLEDRIFRMQSKVEVIPNVSKPTIIPLIPFGGKGADRIMNYIWPSETSGIEYLEALDDFQYDEESRFDCDYHYGREYEDDQEDRDDDVSVEAFMTLEHLHIGYDQEHILTISDEEHLHETLQLNQYRQTVTKTFRLDENEVAVPEDQPFQEGRICSTHKTKDPETHSGSDEGKLEQLQETREIKLQEEYSSRSLGNMNLSFEENDNTSLFSATSTVYSTPSILRLKARKRRLEQFLSAKGFESTIERRDFTCQVQVPTECF